MDKIRQLRERLKKVQLSEPKNRLSEVHCVEIIQRLVNLSLVDMIFTLDGKEYVTPERLDAEIMNEMAIRGGRISLLDLQQATRIDLSALQGRLLLLVQKGTLEIVADSIVSR